MDKIRRNIKNIHKQLEADLKAGDPRTKAFAHSLGGELNAARKSLGMSPLPQNDDIWIGSKFYDSGNGILVLGESTYGGDPPLYIYIPMWCRKEVIDRTFSRIFNSYSGKHTSSASISEREAFWAAIAFCNFVQKPLGPTREHRPTTAHYRSAAAALPAILKKLKPCGVLVLGKGQSEFSEPVLRDAGIPFVVSQHPTARGIKTAELQAKWKELKSKI